MSMSDKNKHWYVVYTKPRWEKKVHSLLAAKGWEAYCPLNRVRKRWSDRWKWVEEPLFKSYVFVRIEEREKPDIRMIGGVLNFVYWLGKPAVVKDREIVTVMKFLNDYEDVVAEPMALTKDARILIEQGILMDQQAKVLKIMNKSVRVLIESIGYSLVATVKRTNVRRVVAERIG